MRYKIYSDRIKLFDAYMIPKGSYVRELEKIRNLHPSCLVWRRSVGNIRREWATHNLAYALGIRRDKTESVDLDYEPKWYHNFMYFVVGTIALYFIK